MCLVRRYGYFICLLTPTLPWQGLLLGQRAGMPDASAWLTLLVVFGLIPLVDRIVGQDRSNLDEAQARQLALDPWLRSLPLLALPMQIASLAGGAYVFVNAGFGPGGQIGWILSIGAISGITGIVSAHELIHRTTRAERLCGGLLLASVCYGSFKVEHVRGHHADIGTGADATTARAGESFYRYFIRLLPRNFCKAWRLEAQRLAQHGLRAMSFRNELIGWSLVSIGIATSFLAWLGWRGLAFFLLQSLVAIALLELIDYIEHYGLSRKRRADGSYQPVGAEHSWNSSFLLSNLFLLQLQRHPDHHLFPRRPYPLLRHIEDSPQLPAGYATMVMIALLPPLWRRIMDARLRAYRERSA
jgi:alkane 1-monooxygenase